MKTTSFFSAAMLLALGHGAVPLHGQDTESAAALNQPILTLAPVTVIGSADGEMRLPGSGTYLPAERIQTQSYTNLNRVAAQVPGVTAREEDGYGNFLNISLRGVDTGRSGKVTMMEDGVLTAPAPYSSPAAYYTPNAGRMSGIEILKGSSQVQYGPHTTGGVINLLSTPVPEEFSFRLKSHYGSDAEFLAFANAGDTVETGIGKLGWLLESWFHRADGFRHIDEKPGFSNGNDTGFTRFEPMLKLFWEPNSTVPQRIEFKLGYTNFEADETYLGLTEEDFGANPYRRYAATRYDNIDTYHWRTYLRYMIEPAEDLKLTATAYYNKFHRNWFKLLDVTPEDGEKTGLANALAEGGDALGVIKGNRAGSVNYRNNNRDYELGGFDLRANYSFETGSIGHEIDMGARFHWDSSERFQRDEFFMQNSSGRFTGSKKGVKGGGGNRQEETYALALHLQDRISIGKLAIIPGVRYEHLELEYRDYDTTGNPSKLTGSETGSMNAFAPGVGLNYEATDALAFFGGVYRGYSVPEPRAKLKDGIDLETSLGYELGARYRKTGFSASSTLFYTDFDNLIVIDNIGAGGSGGSENAGDVNTYGLELEVAYDPGIVNDWGFNLPLRAGFTYTRAELDGDANSEDAESIFSGGRDGNRVPYIPEYQLYTGIGIEIGKFGLHVDATFTPETYATASNTSSLRDPSGKPDARFGKTDSHFIVDVTAGYQLTENFRVFGGIKNVLDETYITSRHPEGARGGAPRMLYAGGELTF